MAFCGNCGNSVVINAPNTTLSAILMMYLFRANALDLEFRERWERERMRASLPSMAD